MSDDVLHRAPTTSGGRATTGQLRTWQVAHDRWRKDGALGPPPPQPERPDTPDPVR